MPRAVVLSSGGLDSTVCFAEAKHLGFDVVAFTFRYGQCHEIEVEAAIRVARAMGASEHRVMHLDLANICRSALTGHGEIPSDGAGIDGASIPSTYVPARNIIFLALAAGLAESVGASDIFIGVNAIDYSGYPDCRPAFIQAFEQTLRVGTKAGVEGNPPHIHTPLINMTKSEIVRRGLELGVDFALTHSCYNPGPNGLACGLCDSCRLRRRGFEEAGVSDPVRYGA